MTPRVPISRRALLRGAGGVAIALPLLEAMTPRRARGAAAAMAPRRMLNFFTENGVVESNWYPSGTEKSWTMPVSLAPLMPFQQNLIVFQGLDRVASGSNGGGGHQRGKTAALTGQGNLNGRAPGISIDQAVANQIGTSTRFKSIEASVYLKGALRDGVFYSAPNQIIVPEDAPAALFARLFSDPLPSQMASDPAMAAAFAKLRARRQSILDRTLDEYKRVSGVVGGGDRMRLDAHVTALRSLEQSLGLIDGGTADASMACKKPPAPNPMDFVTTGKAQMDLLAMALACDLTRVASLQWRSDMTSFTWVGVNNEHHGLSHQQGSPGADAQLTKIVTWNTQQFAYLLGLLKSYQDVGGRTLLDNTLVYWPNELATGKHRLTGVPIVLATGDFTTTSGVKIPTGRYLKYPGGTMDTGMLTRLGQAFGLNIDNFGGQQWHQGPLPNVW
jgi:hypothetical protein